MTDIQTFTAIIALSLLGAYRLPGQNAEVNETNLTELIEIKRDNITVVYTPASKPIVEQIITTCLTTRKCLAPLYGLPEDEPIRVNWIPKNRYHEFSNDEYGFPSYRTNGAILPAADIDLPVSLVRIVDILDLAREKPEDLKRFKKLNGLMESAGTDDILHYLHASKEFYCRYCINFILPHEIAHVFNIKSGTPTRPAWLHEWQAQFAAVLVCRAAGLPDDADLFSLYYRMIYRGGMEKVRYTTVTECYNLGSKKLGVQNYAWYHGALIEMFCQLESAHGLDFGPKVLRELKKSADGKKEISNAGLIAIAGRAAGANLNDYFEHEWGIK